MSEKPADESDDIFLADSYELTALFTILQRKGLINKAEFLEEVERLHRERKRPVDPDPYVVRG